MAVGQLGGTGFALGEISLVLFTTLTPAAVLATVAVVILIIRGDMTEDVRNRLERKLAIPLVISTVGLVASAAHLGTPSNVLYVATGIGRSPLSNEVAWGIAFLVLLGTYWYHAFTERKWPRLEAIWRIALIVVGLAFILFVSLAYSVPSIVSWDDALSPVLLWLNAATVAPSVFLLTVCAAKGLPECPVRMTRIGLIISAVAAAISVVLYVVRWQWLGTVGNFVVTAQQLVPYTPVCIVAFALLCVVGIFLMAREARRGGTLRVSAVVVACICLYTGVFLMRFTFYASHLTVGLTM